MPWYALKLKNTDMWLGLYGRPISSVNDRVLRFVTLEKAEAFALADENEWTIHGPFPEMSQMRSHDLWHDFYSDYWTPQIETMCDSNIYLDFLEWLGENET